MSPAYTRTLPGGAVVTLDWPDRGKGGQHAGSPQLACRLVRPDSWDSGWHYLWSGSVIKARVWWDLVESEADIPDAWRGTVGIWPPPRYDETFREGLTWLDNQ